MIKKILFPTDFSDPSRAALVYAVELAKCMGAQLDIIHVMFDESYLLTMYVPQVTLQNFIIELEEGANQHLDEFLSGCEILKDVQYNKKMLSGTPYLEIVKYIDENNIDLVVMGTHGRTGIEHVLFGSTTEKVVGKAKCPVLTVRDIKEKE